MVSARQGRLVELVGSRHLHRLDNPAYLQAMVPDMAARDLYVCGPGTFSTGVISAARSLGVAAEAVHCESFDL